MAAKDFYGILGVPRDADDAALKKAYRNLARAYHPDRNPGDKKAEDRFKEISEAYSILSDAEKRAQYDRFGVVGGAGGSGEAGFGTISRSRVRRADDLRYDLEITLEDAARGLETKLQVPRLETCETCRGAGVEAGTQPETCGTCRGQGQVRFTQGFLTVARPCPNCRGEGRIIRHPCTGCRGQGRLSRERLLKVTIPAGVENGNQLRLNGEGESGLQGGPAGDLYVVLHLKPHEIFVRDGAHLICELPLTFPQVALGDEVEVPVLDGAAKLKVPAGTQPGQRLLLKGKGMPHLRGRGRGDAVYEVVVEVPTHLTARQRELLEEFRRAHDGDSSPRASKFVERMKQLFGS